MEADVDSMNISEVKLSSDKPISNPLRESNIMNDSSTINSIREKNAVQALLNLGKMQQVASKTIQQTSNLLNTEKPISTQPSSSSNLSAQPGCSSQSSIKRNNQTFLSPPNDFTDFYDFMDEYGKVFNSNCGFKTVTKKKRSRNRTTLNVNEVKKVKILPKPIKINQDIKPKHQKDVNSNVSSNKKSVHSSTINSSSFVNNKKKHVNNVHNHSHLSNNSSILEHNYASIYHNRYDCLDSDVSSDVINLQNYNSKPKSAKFKANSSKKVEVVEENGMRFGILQEPNPGNKNTASKKFCPPIYSSGLTPRAIKEHLASKNLDNIEIIFKNEIDRNNKTKTKILVNDIAAHSEILNFIEVNRAEGFSFAPKSLRKKVLVLKGIDNSYSNDEVLEALSSLAQDSSIDKVLNFSTARSRNLNRILNMRLVILHPGTEFSNLLKINKILHQVITWESYKRNDIQQCFKCQHFGHTMNYCANRLKCVICGGEHQPKQCELNIKNQTSTENREKIVVVCTNCNEPGHIASYRGCKAYANYVQKQKQIKSKIAEMRNSNNLARTQTRNWAHSLRNPNFSYADMARTSNTFPSAPIATVTSRSNPVPQNNIFTEFVDECFNLFNVPFEDLISRIQSFMQDYKSLDDKQKSGAYLRFLCSIVK